jgi:hypothetical protein
LPCEGTQPGGPCSQVVRRRSHNAHEFPSSNFREQGSHRRRLLGTGCRLGGDSDRRGRVAVLAQWLCSCPHGAGLQARIDAGNQALLGRGICRWSNTDPRVHRHRYGHRQGRPAPQEDDSAADTPRDQVIWGATRAPVRGPESAGDSTPAAVCLPLGLLGRPYEQGVLLHAPGRRLPPEGPPGLRWTRRPARRP